MRRRANKEHQRALRTERHPRTFGLEGEADRFARSFEVYFGPRRDDEPVVFFQHIRKTAGTSLRQVIHKNYTDRGALHVVMGSPSGSDRELRHEWVRRYLGSLGADERRELMCVVSHDANYLMHMLDEPVRAITVVRDPVDRVLSNHSFGDRTKRPLEEIYETGPVKDGKPKERLLKFFNGPARTLIDRYYSVGVQDRVEQSLESFARSFGWTDVFVSTAKVNRDRRNAIDDSLRTTILEYNWLDVELHAYASRRLTEGAT